MAKAKKPAFERPANPTMIALGLAAVAFLAVGFYFGPASTTAAGTFLVRGDVLRYDKGNGTVDVYFRHTNSAAEHFAGEVHEINVSNAKFYKYDSKQRKVVSTFGSTLDNAGYEVVVRGTFGSSNAFKANWLVRNDNTVRLRGKVQGQDTVNNFLTVELDTVQYQATKKVYKAKNFLKSKDIRVYYADNSKFRSRDNNTMQEDEMTNDNEKVTIDNVDVRYGSRFVAENKSTIRDGKWTF